MPTLMFHVTNRRNVDSILERGLRTDGGGWDAGYVWMFDDLSIAQTMAATGAWGGQRGDNVVFAIDATGLDVIPDPHPGWGDERSEHAFAVAAHILPEKIEVLP